MLDFWKLHHSHYRLHLVFFILIKLYLCLIYMCLWSVLIMYFFIWFIQMYSRIVVSMTQSPFPFSIFSGVKSDVSYLNYWTCFFMALSEDRSLFFVPRLGPFYGFGLLCFYMIGCCLFDYLSVSILYYIICWMCQSI